MRRYYNVKRTIPTAIDDVEPQPDQIAWRVEQRTDANGKAPIVWIDTAGNATVIEYDSQSDVFLIRHASVWFLGLLPIEATL